MNCLSAVVESNEDTVQKLKTTYPKLSIFSSIDETYAFKFSGYTLATPASTHYKIAKNIMNAIRETLLEGIHTPDLGGKDNTKKMLQDILKRL